MPRRAVHRPPRASRRQRRRCARRSAIQSYLLLTAGFFVCGFQVAFITAHFPAYIADIGIDAELGRLALMLIGFFNIIGSLGSGYIGQR